MSDERTEEPRLPAGDGPVPGLEGLYGNRPVPGTLEDRVVADLTGAGLLSAGRAAGGRGSGKRTDGWGGTWLRIAAGLALFATGWGTGRLASDGPGPGPATPGDTTAAPAAPRFMFLLWEAPGFATGAPSEATAEEYAAWAAGVAGAGTFITGDELAPGHELVPPGGISAPRSRIPDGARLSGYFIVEAPTATEARTLAEGHPHVGHGGWIEVAQVVAR